jgi:predicted RNA-binding protein Jag
MEDKKDVIKIIKSKKIKRKIKKKTPKNTPKETADNNSVKTPNNDIQELIKEYLESMDDKTRIAYQIAQDHLETSFCIEKSLGFLEFKRLKN